MKSIRILTVLTIVLVTGFAYGQSLSEIAKKEKQRREQNEKKGEEVLVITEQELTRGRRPSSTETEDSAPSPASPSTTTGTPSRRPTTTPPSSSSDETAVEGEVPDVIPPGAPLRDKIAIFEQMLVAYRLQVREIDQEIAQNNARIEEIQQKLNTIGAGGLPVTPTAPTVDQSVRYEGEAPALQSEQNDLKQKNQELEARKRQLAEELRQKGRRAGIPAGYLRF